MHNSKEELIALDDISTSSSRNGNKLQLRKSNKIQSPSEQSPAIMKEKQIVSMFSARASTSSQKHKLDKDRSQSYDSQTLSELSDDFIIEKSETCPSKSEGSRSYSRSYKDKLKDRFKSIKQQAGKSSKKATIQSASNSNVQHHIERIRKESSEIDSEVKFIRSKFNLGESSNKVPDSSVDTVRFFTGINIMDQEGINNDGDEKYILENVTVHNVLPEKLGFNIEVSEKELCFIPKSNPVDMREKITEDYPRYPEEEGLYINSTPNVPKFHLNILEQRLALSGEKKWFTCDGTLDIISNPLVDRSVKPTKPTETNEFQPPPIVYKLPKTKTEFECEEIVVIKENILEFYLNTVKFIHHPLFSVEHVLKEKLTQLYEKYNQSAESNHLQKIRNHLEALRHAKKHAQLIKNQSGDSSNDRIQSYVSDIKKLREEYLEESKNSRDTLKTIIELWKTLKKLRNSQKYSNTDVKLLLKKEKVDYETETSNYDEFFQETLQEVIEECKINTKRKIKKRKERKKNESEQSDNSDSVATEGSASEQVELDRNKIAFKLRKRFEECLKPPGEPNIKLLLTNSNEITKDVASPEEITRRHVVSSTRFAIKILCNKINVCKSKLKPLNDDFTLEFDESFSIQLCEVPEFLTVELIEYPKGLLKKKICQMQVPVPSVNARRTDKFCEERFVKTDVVHYNKHSGVGSGITLDDVLRNSVDLSFPASLDIGKDLNTAGVLGYKLRWEKSCVSQEETVENFGFEVLDKVIDKNGIVDSVKFSEWMEKCAPDPQDPKNCVLYEYMEWKDTCVVGDSEKRCFRLSPYSETTNFCDISQLDNNVRFQILQLRDQHEVEFDNTMIPNRIKEISVNLLNDYKKRKTHENKRTSDQALDQGNEDLDDDNDEFEGVRSSGKKQLKQVQMKVFQRCKNSENNLDYDSVVNERYLTYFEQVTKTILRNFLNWFRWRPKVPVPLPSTKSLSVDKSLEEHLKNFEQAKVSIKVVSAKCIPSRLKETFNHEITEEDVVCPFVEVSHKEFRCRTNTQKGSNCVWNENIVIPLGQENVDYLNPNALNGNISINLFDEIRPQSRKADSDESFVVNWLGEVTVPLSVVCSATCVKGYFKVKLPPLLLGYETICEKQASSNNKSPKPDNAILKSQRKTYLEVEISVTQPVPVLSPNMADLPSNDTPYIREHILKWNEDYNRSFPNRRFHALAIDSSSRTNCVTKYIRALEPPQINDEFDVTADQCARYVSLIPVTDCSQFYQNIWLTSDQLIKYMIGSINDHAVTLTCFLLALKLDAWLLLGFGVPHGSTSYVLVREYNTEASAHAYSVWDVVSGEKYNLTDPYCPLQEVYCLVNGENVWGNTQRTNNVALTRFELDRRSDWMPLFNEKFEAPTNFLNTKIGYKISDAGGIELRLERKIRKKISKLRQLDRTVWNHTVSMNVKNMLKMFEINSMYGKSNTDVVADLKSCLSQYRVNGFLLNLPFTTISDIIRAIQKTNIHIQEPTSSEFILAVFLQPYPGRVLSVWIFLAVILPD